MEKQPFTGNTFLAIALSILVILAWQYFYMGPKIEAERQAAELAAQRQAQTQQSTTPQPSGDGSVQLPTPGGETGAPSAQLPLSQELSREAAISETPRIPLETGSLTGSINLKGARIDDLRLKKYRETVDETSPLITLLSPAQSPRGYFAEFGYAPTAGLGSVPDAETVWQAAGGQELGAGSPVTLTFTNDKNITFKREIALDENYMFTITDTIENQSGEAITAYPYGRVVRFEKPQTGGISAILHEGPIAYLGEESRLNEIDYDDLENVPPLKPVASANEGWLGITDKYWATAMVPSSTFQPRFAHFTDGRQRYQIDYLGSAINVASGSNGQVTQRLFAGAKERELLSQYETEGNIVQFDTLIDWGWFYFITRPMAWFLHLLYSVVGNFGVAILLITVVVKAIFYPLANLSYASMAKMKKLQPEMTRIRELHAEDKMKQQQEMMALYKKEQINPAAGCWPILIQIPVFFALYKVLYVSLEMRHAPFFGWVQDLSAPDPTSIFNLFGILPFEVGGIFLIGIWPIIMGITMFLQMQMNPAPPDPTQQMIFKWMPLVFTFMLATFPAGLVIYWAWNNTLSIIQQAIIMRKHGVKIELMDNLKGLFSRKKEKDEPAE